MKKLISFEDALIKSSSTIKNMKEAQEALQLGEALTNIQPLGQLAERLLPNIDKAQRDFSIGIMIKAISQIKQE